MPKREIDLMGYIGEAVVEQWLRKTYQLPGDSIVFQIMPVGVSRRGGGYLDFGVVRNRFIEAIYEVKSQDYILGRDFPLNAALSYIWNNTGQELEFVTQYGKHIEAM